MPAPSTVPKRRRDELTLDALRIHTQIARKNLIQAAGKADGLGRTETHRLLMASVAAVDDVTDGLAGSKLADHAELEGVAPEEQL